MEQDLMNETQLLKDSIIDRIHDLVAMGDYLNATAVYEEFKENFQEQQSYILITTSRRMKLRNLIKVVEKVIAPEPLEEIKEEDIECAIDEQVVPCEELQEPEPPYTGYPAPAYLVDDPWFGPAPTLTEKQMDYMQIETEVKMQEEKEREESGSEPENIHQLMYEMATKNAPTTIQLNPIGGSEMFQGGSENVHR